MPGDGEGEKDSTGEEEVGRESDNDRRRQLVPPTRKSRAQCLHASFPTALYASWYPDWDHPTAIEIVRRLKVRGLVPGAYINFNVEGRIAQFTVHRVVRPVHDDIRHMRAARYNRRDGYASRHVDVLEV